MIDSNVSDIKPVHMVDHKKEDSEEPGVSAQANKIPTVDESDDEEEVKETAALPLPDFV